mmetsp:Transcript_14864/g.27475  ORF Transcript_14864/g.27475 Transcript_14864/m.27475 type:complete len:453 (+) Transcript_14864:514-1872(+)
MASRMILNSQLSIPDSTLASNSNQRRSFLGRKILLRPIANSKKLKDWDGDRPYSVLDNAETGIIGSRISEIYKHKQSIDESVNEAEEPEKELLKDIAKKTRAVSSLYSPENYNFTCSLYIHKALQSKLSEKSLSKSVCFEKSEHVPKAKWKWTERIKWNRRPQHANSPLAILNFEGVLGDFFEDNFWAKRLPALYLRPGWLKGLRQLSKNMQLVLVASCSHSKLNRLLELLEDRKFRFDAVYKKHGFKSERHLLNYSQIIKEFNIRKPVYNSAIVISSILLDDSEIDLRCGQDLLFDSSVSLGRRWLSLNTPTSQDHSTRPALFLVPNPRLQTNCNSMPFDSISGSVHELYVISSSLPTFSFKAAMASADPACFYSIKKIVVPELATRKSFKMTFEEANNFTPVKGQSSSPDCLVFPATFCVKKPYVRIELDSGEGELKKVIRFRITTKVLM